MVTHHKEPPEYNIEERQTMRFTSDENNTAQIDLNCETERFSPTINALVIDESHHGCGLVTLANPHLTENTQIKLRVGKLAPMQASIEWCQHPTPQILILGCKYLE